MKKPDRRTFLKSAAACAAALAFAEKARGATTPTIATAAVSGPPRKPAPNIPSMVEADGSLQLDFDEEHLVLAGGLQPSMLCTRSGTIIVQAQMPEKPFPSPRMHYPYALATVVSRDGAKTWTRIPLKPGENGFGRSSACSDISARGPRRIAISRRPARVPSARLRESSHPRGVT